MFPFGTERRKNLDAPQSSARITKSKPTRVRNRMQHPKNAFHNHGPQAARWKSTLRKRVRLDCAASTTTKPRASRSQMWITNSSCATKPKRPHKDVGVDLIELSSDVRGIHANFAAFVMLPERGYLRDRTFASEGPCQSLKYTPPPGEDSQTLHHDF